MNVRFHLPYDTKLILKIRVCFCCNLFLFLLGLFVCFLLLLFFVVVFFFFLFCFCLIVFFFCMKSSQILQNIRDNVMDVIT